MKNIQYLKDAGIDVDSSLVVFGNKEVYIEKLGEFLVGVHTKIKQIIVFMQKQDLQNYATYVSSLVSDAQVYGFDSLAKLARIHYEKASSGDYSYIRSHINDLINECNRAIVLIQEFLNDVDEEVVAKAEESDTDDYDCDTILVVDDSNIIRSFVERIFSDKYDVESAKDGKEAIEIIDANKDNDYIKAILLDLKMPKVDGFGVLEYMRQNGYLEKIPVSIISGDSTKETIKRAFTYDIVDMLGKPFDDKSIRRVVEKTLMVQRER